ncbi:MAG TPA: fused MFS/spermidine synthase [Thermoanaerobaculia bacterium]|jgi:spermidine synthase|nr:fused MFS/spermidine synthase [Thermoanaerobaculia bacterium]
MPRLRFYWVVAACGAVVMALEILASRVLAPAFGNSVYVWGSIISVFLAALAAGYRLGGHLADRQPSLVALGRLVLFAALSEALLLLFGKPLATALGHATGGSPAGTLVATALLFGPASLLLATVSPYAVRLAAHDLGHLGDTAGRLFALSTAGSLVGTLGCTFVLIPFLELRAIFGLLVAATAATGAVALAGGGRRERWSWALVVALVAVALVRGLWPEALPAGVLYSGITPYQSLEVGDLDERRYLTSNGMLEGAIITADGEPGLAYARTVALAALFQPQLRRALFLGMGAANAGTYLQRRLPALEVDYVDIDPQVPRLARRFFGFEDGPQSRVHVADARRFLAASRESWDLVFTDTYIGLAVPFHLTTREFMSEVQRHLAPGGVFGMNLAAGLDDPFSQAIYRTVRDSFPSARAFAARGSSNVVLLAGPGAEGYLPDLQARARQLDRKWPFSPSLRTLLAMQLTVEPDLTTPVLRDDFAPVEHLIPVGRMRAVDTARWRELRAAGLGAADGAPAEEH